MTDGRKDKVVGIGTMIPDNANMNRGTLSGRGLLRRSFMDLGAGRSILIDRNGRIIAGNKSHEAAMQTGISEVVVVEAERDEIVAVRRTDMDLDTKEGREMAALDNTTTLRNLAWDESALQYISQRFGVETRDFGVVTKDWGDGYAPNLNPAQQNSGTTGEDIERARERLDSLMEQRKAQKETRRVRCPNCGFEFDVQKYD